MVKYRVVTDAARGYRAQELVSAANESYVYLNIGYSAASLEEAKGYINARKKEGKVVYEE